MAATWDGPFLDIDPLTLSAIVQMQIEDGEEMAAGAKNKQREGTVTDGQMALEMYMEDLKSCDATLKDRQMAQSIAIAVLQDGALLAEAYRLEQQAARDHEMAARLFSGSMRAAPQTSSHASSSKTKKDAEFDPWNDEEMLDKVAAIYMNPPQVPQEGLASQEDVEPDSDTATVAESSVWAATRKNVGKPGRRVCIACGDEKDHFELARVPCNHEYCRPCLESLFALSMKDETLFPPRCDHQEIPIGRVEFFLPQKLVKEFRARYDELSTKNRTYCHDRLCAAFIPTAPNDEYGTCPRCKKTTCTTCKSPSHTGDCPEDTALQQLLETANASQWQRCYQCARVVELNTGCNHISCPCGAQFCYVCGQRWRTCECEQWDERRLVERAAQIVDRNPRRRLYQPQRVAHTQPARRPSTAASTAAIVNGPSHGVVTTPQIGNEEAAWESDFSDHSEWQHDWWLNRDDNDDETLSAPEDEVPLPTANSIKRAESPAPTPTSFLVDRMRDHRIRAAMQNLRDNHECEHEKWRWVRGRHQCEECRHWLPEYIFECRQCELQACNRCRRNRL